MHTCINKINALLLHDLYTCTVLLSSSTYLSICCWWAIARVAIARVGIAIIVSKYRGWTPLTSFSIVHSLRSWNSVSKPQKFLVWISRTPSHSGRLGTVCVVCVVCVCVCLFVCLCRECPTRRQRGACLAGHTYCSNDTGLKHGCQVTVACM